MTIETKKKILEVANFIVDNHATKKQAQDKFNLSKSSIKKYINDKDKLQAIDYNLYLKVKNVQNEIIDISNENGGQLSNRINIDNDEEIKMIAEEMIKKEMTLVDTSAVYGIPIFKLYERLCNLNNQKIMDYLIEKGNKY